MNTHVDSPKQQHLNLKMFYPNHIFVINRHSEQFEENHNICYKFAPECDLCHESMNVGECKLM